MSIYNTDVNLQYKVNNINKSTRVKLSDNLLLKCGLKAIGRAVSVWKMQDLLLLLLLFFLYHRLQPDGEQTGLAGSTEEDEEQVMITNRYFQWVIRSQGSHGLG